MNDVASEENFIVGLGHPRCGTGFASSLLKDAGLDVGHEFIKPDGVVSWQAVTGGGRVPWGDALGPLDGYQKIFCVARAPLASFPSIVPENRIARSYNFRRTWLKSFHGNHVLPENPRRDLLPAVASYVYWFELCLSRDPALIFRVEHAEDDEKLSDFAKRLIQRTTNTHRNARPQRNKPEFLIADLERLPLNLLKRLHRVTVRLGYPQDAAEIAKLLSI